MINIIDIGASEGLFTTYVATRRSRGGKGQAVRVLAVEPIPRVAAKIKLRPNVSVLIKAVLPNSQIPVSGKVLLNIFKNDELSSIHPINANINKDVWINHLAGTALSEIIEVPAITLEALIISNNLLRVDFLKIDTQGSDLDVLESAGSMLDRIKAVVIELPYSSEYSIYASEVTLIDAIQKAKELGFLPVRMVPNGGGECNLFLIREDFSLEDYFNLEKELALDKAPVLKIGRHDPNINSSWPLRLFAAFKYVLANILRTKKLGWLATK